MTKVEGKTAGLSSKSIRLFLFSATGVHNGSEQAEPPEADHEVPGGSEEVPVPGREVFSGLAGGRGAGSSTRGEGSKAINLMSWGFFWSVMFIHRYPGWRWNSQRFDVL